MKSGFTLIELLVVIAIIGVLSSVVMSSITTARVKAYDAKVKGQLSNIRSAAEVYFSTRFNYGASTTANACITIPPTAGTMFADTASNLAQLSISSNYPVGENTIVCNSSGTAYAVGDNLSAGSGYWCVDSTGVSRSSTTALTTGVTCP
jgi:prepilin-type N-terminal cleavage/methylation domain-containing protein